MTTRDNPFDLPPSTRMERTFDAMRASLAGYEVLARLLREDWRVEFPEDFDGVQDVGYGIYIVTANGYQVGVLCRHYEYNRVCRVTAPDGTVLFDENEIPEGTISGGYGMPPLWPTDWPAALWAASITDEEFYVQFNARLEVKLTSRRANAKREAK